MPERLDKLRLALAELETELRDVEALDDTSRTLLSEVARDISVVLARNEPSTPAPHTLQERLTESVETFETAHPTLAGIVRRLIDGLGQMGI